MPGLVPGIYVFLKPAVIAAAALIVVPSPLAGEGSI
jgi:hypothetical protein